VVAAGEQSVTYICVGCAGTDTAGNGNGVLYRHVRAFSDTHSCPLTAPAGAAMLANNVSNASFFYNGSDLQRNATVQINLSLTQSNETVTLYHEVHADNTP
jgi:MSHA biogenesis protein MshO